MYYLSTIDQTMTTPINPNITDLSEFHDYNDAINYDDHDHDHDN